MTLEQTVNRLNRESSDSGRFSGRFSGGNGHPWTYSDLERIELGDTSLPFERWLAVFRMMGREVSVIEAAHDEQGLYLAEAEKQVDPAEQLAARRKLEEGGGR